MVAVASEKVRLLSSLISLSHHTPTPFFST
jgi:hypothetical protein